MTRNFYRFSTFTAAAALGLGLMVSGCADGGGGKTPFPFGPVNPTPSPTVSPDPSPTVSPEPSPEPTISPSPTPVSDKGTLKIGFSILDTRADVSVNVSSYNFYLMIGEEESQTEEGVEKKADETTPGQQTVTFEEVDTNVDHVVIEYLDADGKIVGMNDEAVEIKAGEETELEDFEMKAASDLSMVGSADFIKIDEEVTYTCSVIFGEEEDELQREVPNEDVTFEIAESAPYSGSATVVEAKEGEAGTFVGTGEGWVLITAEYLEGIDAEAEIIVSENDLEIKELMICGWEQWDPEIDLYLLYNEDAPNNFDVYNGGGGIPEGLLPRVSARRNLRVENDGDADMPPAGFHPSAVVGANTVKLRLVGRAANDWWITLTPEECEIEGDSFSVSSNGQEIMVSVTEGDASGKLSVSFTGKEEGAETLTTEVKLSSIEAQAKLYFYDQGPTAMPEEVTVPVNYLPLEQEFAPAVLYTYTPPAEEGSVAQMEWYGPFFTKNSKDVEFSMSSESSAFSMETIGPNDDGPMVRAKVTIGNTAQIGDTGTFTATIEGCELDMPSVKATIGNEVLPEA
ncbi:MAG: hypothetical protein K6G50_05965 [bacterium]|nr:hypothetical protein [bacterium]